MAARKKKPTKVTGDRKIKALIFGPPGHGKTHFVGTAALDPRTTPIAIIDFEGGVPEVLTGLPGKGTKWVSYPVNSMETLNAAFSEIADPDNGFKAAAVDSLSELHTFFLMTVLEKEYNTNAKRQDPDKMEIQDYGIAMVQLRRFVRYLRDLDMHVFYTAHSKEEVDPREGQVVLPKMAGQMAHEIPGMMTLSGYLALSQNDEGETERLLLLQGYARIRTKVRTQWGEDAPDEIEDPTVTTLLDTLNY